MLTLYSNVGFYLFGSKVFGDTSETNEVKGPRFFICPSPALPENCNGPEK